MRKFNGEPEQVHPNRQTGHAKSVEGQVSVMAMANAEHSHAHVQRRLSLILIETQVSR